MSAPVKSGIVVFDPQAPCRPWNEEKAVLGQIWSNRCFTSPNHSYDGAMQRADDPTSALLDAYATQRCEVRLQHAFDDEYAKLTRPEHSAATERRIDAGRSHEERVLEKIAKALGDSCRTIAQESRRSMQAATLTAIEEEVPVIAQAWLPADESGRRIGRPDLLIRGTDGYLPVEIKLHLLTTAGNATLKTSPLSNPFSQSSVSMSDRKFRKGGLWFNDALQIAHYARMLEAMGARASDRLLGGIIDGSETLWWINSDLTHGRTHQRPLDAYDVLFADRLALVDATLRRNNDRSLPRARDPWWHKECESCPYSEICYEELEAIDDVSLVRWSGTEALATLRTAGVTTRAQLADLDLSVIDLGARLAETSMPLSEVLERAGDAGPEVELAELVGQRLGVRRHLAASGFITVDDLLHRDQRSLNLAGVVRDLGRSVRRARAGVAGGVVLGVAADAINAKRADVEVDIDMESYEHATYLWGALVTTNVPADDIEEGYVPFVTFDPLDNEREAALFGEFWRWLIDLRRRVVAQGLTFRSYCFWHPAEEGQMRRAVKIGGADLPRERELAAFFGSGQWIDLHQLCKEQLITEGPLGLKAMATIAGFSWRDDDPSGEASIAWYEEAIATDSEILRQRLLDYNEDDVLATRALRIWLDGPARLLHHVDEV